MGGETVPDESSRGDSKIRGGGGWVGIIERGRGLVRSKCSCHVHYVFAGSESAIPHNKDGHQEWTPFAS